MELMEKLLDFDLYEPVRISGEFLERLGVHSREYIKRVEQCSVLLIPYLSRYSADTPCFEGILEWALAYCGGAVMGCRLIMEGKNNVIFNIAGGFHHAKYDDDGGFCVFNDCALALLYLHEHVRAAYLDIDAHAGDGTYLILYDKPILKISIHEDPHFLYPGRGFIWEVGKDEGYGYTLNIPLYPQSGDRDFVAVIDKIVIPLLKAYGPETIILQCGVDGYYLDPLTHLNYTIDSYIYVAKQLRDLRIPILICPGGGYSKDAAILHTIIAAYLSNQESRIMDEEIRVRDKTPEHARRASNIDITHRIISKLRKTHPIFKIFDVHD